MNLNIKKEETERFLFSALSHQEETVFPEFIEQSNLEWVKYGKDNHFDQELLSLFEKSSIHSAIIETKTRMMVGDGIIQDVHDDEISENTQLFLDKVNPYESMTEVYKKCAMDFEIYGLAYLEVLWGKGRTQIAELHHIDATKIRWGKIGENNRVTKFYYSRDWSNYRRQPYSPVPIPIFNSEGTDARQLIPIVRYTPGLDYYAFPDYISATKWIAVDIEIANFHFNNLKNGMSPSIFFGFPVGETTNAEREEIEKKIIDKYQGTNQSGKFILAFYDAEGEKKPEITILEQSNADKQYDLLNKTTLQQILIGHKVVNENLVGISTPGKLGSSNEVLQNYELYYNTVVEPEQTKVLEPFKKIMLINGMNDIKIQYNSPISITFGENILEKILTEDEMREIIGYEPKPIVDASVSEDDIIPENEIMEDASGITVKNIRYNYDFAGVRTIDKNNAGTVIQQANLKDLYVWRMATVGNKKNCPSCIGFNGITRALETWLRIAIPGQQTETSYGSVKSQFPHKPYGTYCEDACNCRLVKVGRTT